MALQMLEQGQPLYSPAVHFPYLLFWSFKPIQSLVLQAVRVVVALQDYGADGAAMWRVVEYEEASCRLDDLVAVISEF
jgi:hypothetical protein